MGNTICVKCSVPITYYNDDNFYRYSCRYHKIVNDRCIHCNLSANDSQYTNCRHIWRKKMIFCC